MFVIPFIQKLFFNSSPFVCHSAELLANHPSDWKSSDSGGKLMKTPETLESDSTSTFVVWTKPGERLDPLYLCHGAMDQEQAPEAPCWENQTSTKTVVPIYQSECRRSRLRWERYNKKCGHLWRHLGEILFDPQPWPKNMSKWHP